MPNNRSQEFIAVMDRFRKVTHKYGAHGALPPGEFMMLMSINCNIEKNKENDIKLPGIRVSELSEILHASKPATSRMINNIEEKELVERIIDKKDRRNVYVTLTAKGKETIDAAKKEADRAITQILDQLGEEDTTELIRIFNNLIELITKHNNEVSMKGSKRML